MLLLFWTTPPPTGNAPAANELPEILSIAELCRFLCGGQGSVDMGLVCREVPMSRSLRGFLQASENGVPQPMTRSAGLFRLLRFLSSSGRRFTHSMARLPPRHAEREKFVAIRVKVPAPPLSNSAIPASRQFAHGSPPGLPSNALVLAAESPPTRKSTEINRPFTEAI